MTLGERLRVARKTVTPKVSQEQFGLLLGASRTSVADYELNRVVPSDTFIKLLSAKFGVNEEWLRTGAGDMFSAAPELLDELQDRFNLSEDEATIAAAMLTAAPEQRRRVFEALSILSGWLKK